MKKKAKKRTPLSEIDRRMSCSIVGTCLTLKELQKLGRKMKISGLAQIKEYDLHHIYVRIANDKTPANRYLQKFIDHKFRDKIHQLSCIKEVDLLEKAWKKALKTGDIAATYWALITHPAVTIALIDEIYAEVHMLSHIAGASMRVDLHELSVIRRENQQLKRQQQQRYQKHNRTLYGKEALIRKQEKQLEKRQIEINALNVALMQTPYDDRSNTLQQTKHKLHSRKEKITFLEQSVADYKLKWESATTRQVSLQAQLGQTKEALNVVESLLESYLVKAHPNACGASNTCSHRDLKGQCILYVGGRDQQCRHFKPLVENNNGKFIHHDGGLSDGSSKLNSILVKADIVMCPLDCISHEAMIKVKKHCKISEKTLVMMPHSSLSAFSKGLNDIDSNNNTE
ncbi:MAG: DUF2325 domain-containing protein [Cocleimonas sp.]|nr:DUF2325 domain-containing protein [Cocleimonas sp.]